MREGDKMEKAYRLPDPDKDPISFLVILYKTLKKIEYNNREWDKIYFARCMKRTKQLLECLNGDVRKAAQCLQDLKDKFEGDGLNWTIETIIQYCFEWRSEFNKINDRDCLRELGKAYAGSGVENLIKEPEKQRYQLPAPLVDKEPTEEERQIAIKALQEIKSKIPKIGRPISKATNADLELEKQRMS